LDHKDIGIVTRITTYKNTRKGALGSQDTGDRTLATMFTRHRNLQQEHFYQIIQEEGQMELKLQE
jgi:hypothetical protein